ncbi:hypothetical protein M758_3G040600 [Ceratodon purpureus]|nr:hypothetical protein M758_3G040600 [Ceratodon purpureus]
MCPGLRPEMDRMPSFVDREGAAQTFARSFSNHFTQSWEELLQAQDMSPEALAAMFCSSLEKLYVQSGYWRKQIFKEFFRQMFASIALYLTCALAGLDVLSRHLSYPVIATAAGRSRIITGYFSLTISSANLLFNVSLYSAICCLCILLYLKMSSFLFDNARQQPVVVQPVDANDPNAAQLKNEAIVAQIVAVVDLPFMVFNGCLTDPLRRISLFTLVFATLASLLSFIVPTLWQLFFWGVTIFAVYFVATVVTILTVT